MSSALLDNLVSEYSDRISSVDQRHVRMLKHVVGEECGTDFLEALESKEYLFVNPGSSDKEVGRVLEGVILEAVNYALVNGVKKASIGGGLKRNSLAEGTRDICCEELADKFINRSMERDCFNNSFYEEVEPLDKLLKEFVF